MNIGPEGTAYNKVIEMQEKHHIKFKMRTLGNSIVIA